MTYKVFFADKEWHFFEEPFQSKSNYWLNVIILKDKNQRDLFLDIANSKGVHIRPTWTLMNKLSMFKNSQCGELANANWLEERVVNLPSSSVIS